ncbi:MAG: histidinol-phosphatase [Erysipelothrix sp.]|nr:histidinol-phosphatase [Erysipelothrix sp.]
MKINYHTHTTRCKHAYGSDEAYVMAAIKAGYDELGMSEHSPWVLHPGETAAYRMELEDMDDYMQSMRTLREKYKDQITIHIGLEAEYFRDRFDWLVDFKKQHALDFIIFGNHNRDRISYHTYYGDYHAPDLLLDHYVEDAIEAMSTGFYSIFAHPDLYFKTLNVVNQDTLAAAQALCEAANHYQVPLEYNLGGFRYGDNAYPKAAFWEIAAKNKNVTIIGVDAHDPDHLLDDKARSDAQAYLHKIGVNLVEAIEFK